MEVFKSATKITLLALVFGLIGITIFQIPASDLFKTAVTLVLGFYFGQKQNTSSSVSVEEKKADPSI